MCRSQHGWFAEACPKFAVLRIKCYSVKQDLEPYVNSTKLHTCDFMWYKRKSASISIVKKFHKWFFTFSCISRVQISHVIWFHMWFAYDSHVVHACSHVKQIHTFHFHMLNLSREFSYWGNAFEVRTQAWVIRAPGPFLLGYRTGRFPHSDCCTRWLILVYTMLSPAVFSLDNFRVGTRYVHLWESMHTAML